MFQRQASDFHFIAVTVVLVALVGVQGIRDMVEDDLGTASAKTSSIASEISENKNKDHQLSPRLPASVPSVLPKTISTLENFTHLDLNCSQLNLQPIAVKGSFLQIQGKSCRHEDDLKDLEIINNTNGYTASIFLRGATGYQTDLIQLQNGENEITVKYRESSGKAVQQTVKVVSSQL